MPKIYKTSDRKMKIKFQNDGYRRRRKKSDRMTNIFERRKTIKKFIEPKNKKNAWKSTTKTEENLEKNIKNSSHRTGGTASKQQKLLF